MSELPAKKLGINENLLALPVPLTTEVLQEESLPAIAAKGGKKVRAIRNSEVSR